ncbi:MAG: zinc ribbon domain-containing protein [bacterium]
MPIFEYHCPDCQEDFEELRTLSDRDRELPCPRCGSLRPQRRVSLFASASSAASVSTSCTPRGGFT